MREIIYFLLILSVALISIVHPISAADNPTSYLAIKGGLLSLDKIENEGGNIKIDLDTEDGYGGEIALGHYFLPFLAIELEGGYFEINYSRDSIFIDDVKLQIVPVLATLKVLLPLGPIEPFGEFGGGVYLAQFDAEGNLVEFSDSSDTYASYGLHAGGGLNLNLTDTFYLGAEGRYIWSKPSWVIDDAEINDIEIDDIEIDGYTVTGVLGLRF